MRSVDDGGRTIREDTVLDNLSDRGAYLRVTQTVKEGSDVVIAVRLSTATDPQLLSLQLVASGVSDTTGSLNSLELVLVTVIPKVSG